MIKPLITGFACLAYFQTWFSDLSLGLDTITVLHCVSSMIRSVLMTELCSSLIKYKIFNSLNWHLCKQSFRDSPKLQPNRSTMRGVITLHTFISIKKSILKNWTRNVLDCALKEDTFPYLVMLFPLLHIVLFANQTL